MRDIEPQQVRKILVREVNWVGDAILTLPALEALDRRFPSAEIVVSGRPWVLGIFRGQPSVDRLLAFDSAERHRGLRGRWRLAGEIRQERFDLAVVFPNSMDAALVPWLAAIPRRVGYPTDGRGLLLTHPVKETPRPTERHQVFRYLGLARALGGEADGVPRLHVTADAVMEADRLLAGHGVPPDAVCIAVNPGSVYGSAKRWPADRFALVADHLARQWKARVLLVGSARETGVLDAVARVMKEPSISLGGRTSIAVLPGLLRRARLLLTNDTGAMHVAAAVGTPVLAVFGPTDAVATGPLGPRAAIVETSVPCSPCLLRECPIDHRCVQGVTVGQVIRAAEAM